MNVWPREKEDLLCKLHGEGVTIRECAAVLGYSYPAVQSKVLRLGLSSRHMPSQHANPEFIRLRAEGKTAKHIAAVMGASVKRVQNWIAEGIRQGTITPRQCAVARPVWTDERVAELRRLWATDMGPTAIARVMGSSCNAISGKATALGLPKKGYPKSRKPAPPRVYRIDHLHAFARKPRPKPTETLWDKTETSRPFFDRTPRECAWPLGERGDYHACCAPTMEGDTYCEHHRLMAGGHRVAWVARQPERQAA